MSAVRNVRMADVARATGLEPSFGQSPFAIARGEQFERSLFYDEAGRLLTELSSTGVLPDGASGFVDLRLRMNGGSRLGSLDEAIEETRSLFQRIASAPPKSLPAVAAGATVRIPRGVMLPEAILIIDVIAIRADSVREG